MKIRIAILFYLILSLAVVGAVEAQEGASINSKIIEIDSRSGTDNKAQKCEDNSYAMSACRSFIKGFIQGALLTDTAIIKSLEATEPSFAEVHGEIMRYHHQGIVSPKG